MYILYLLALSGAFLAATSAALGILPSPSQMYELRSKAAARAEVAAIQSPLLRLIWPLLAALAPFMGRLGSASYRAARSREIPLAGLPAVVKVDHLLALKVLLAGVVPVVVGGQFDVARHPVVFAGLGVLGFMLPDRMVTEMRHLREQRVLRALPSAVDMLTLSVEAGMDFLAALQRVGEKSPPGPLREEVMTIVNDIRLGESRAGALRAFANRVDIPEVVSFVGVLVQADKLGASIGGVLRAQSDIMRIERFQRAEKAGAKATQAILLPLALFIVPAVLLVILGPVALSFIYGGVGL